MNTKKGELKSVRQCVGRRVPFARETTWGDLLLWQTWQLHAALRKRFLQNDPQAVAMLDTLVTDFYLKWELDLTDLEITPDRLIAALGSGQKALGEVLSNEECYALMRTPAVIKLGGFL